MTKNVEKKKRGRPPGSATRKKYLMEFLKARGFDYMEEFIKAFEASSPEEQLRWFGKTMPFVYQRVDSAPQLEANVNIIGANIRSFDDLKDIIAKDPFLDASKLIEVESREIKGEKDGDKSEDDGSELGSEVSGCSEASVQPGGEDSTLDGDVEG